MGHPEEGPILLTMRPLPHRVDAATLFVNLLDAMPASRIRLGIILLVLTYASIAGLLCFLALRPAPVLHSVPLPNPNGYDDFVKAGRVASPSAADFLSMSQNELREFVTQNSEALKLVRSGLAKECRVPIEFSTNYFNLHLPELASIKSLGRILAAEGRLAEMENRPRDAAQSYLDTVRFGQQSARGGFLLDKLVGIALESIGLKPLEKLSQTLDAKQCRQTIQQLEIVEANEEPPQEVFQKEAALTHHAPLSQRLAALVAFKSIQSNQQKYQQKISAAEKRRRLLLLDLATRAYQLENGLRPPTVSALVPAYLKSIPQDPATGTNLP